MPMEEHSKSPMDLVMAKPGIFSFLSHTLKGKLDPLLANTRPPLDSTLARSLLSSALWSVVAKLTWFNYPSLSLYSLLFITIPRLSPKLAKYPISPNITTYQYYIYHLLYYIIFLYSFIYSYIHLFIFIFIFLSIYIVK